MGNAHGGAARAIGVTADAFVGDVQVFAIAVEELPQRLRSGMRLGICVTSEFCELDHGSTTAFIETAAKSRGRSIWMQDATKKESCKYRIIFYILKTLPVRDFPSTGVTGSPTAT